MRSSVLLNALCVAGALATPIEKRAVVTDLTIVTITEYVTLPAPAATPAPTSQQQPTSSPAPAPAPAPSSSSSAAAKVPVADGADDVKVVKVTKAVPAAGPEPSQAPAPNPDPAPAPAPSSSAPAQQPAPQGPPGPNAPIDQQAIWYHNQHRSNHSADPLTWNAGLAGAAQKLANTCNFAHNTDIDKATTGSYGQNIGWGASSWGDFITNMMYNGEMFNYEKMNLYGVESPPGGDSLDLYGHFTQMVWKDSKTVGCATTNCGGSEFMVCNYGPVGNVIGHYAENVGRPLGAAMAVA